MSNAVRILSLRRAKHPRHGVTVYGTAQSRSRPRINHGVVKVFGKWSCSCETQLFNPEGECDHIKAAKAELKRREVR